MDKWLIALVITVIGCLVWWQSLMILELVAAKISRKRTVRQYREKHRVIEWQDIPPREIEGVFLRITNPSFNEYPYWWVVCRSDASDDEVEEEWSKNNRYCVATVPRFRSVKKQAAGGEKEIRIVELALGSKGMID